MELTVFSDESGFEALRAEWNSLLQTSRTNPFFMTWEWQTTWWRCLGGGDLCLLAWRDGGQLVGLAPLYLASDDSGVQRLTTVGCVDVSDYLDVIAAPKYEAAVCEALLDWLGSADAPRWDVLQLCNLPQDSPSISQLPVAAARRGLNCVTTVEDVCPLIELPDTFDIYLQDNLSKKQRHEVRRKLRRIEEGAAVSWYVVDAAAPIQPEIDAFIQLHRLSATEKRNFMTPEMARFFQEITVVMHQAGWLYLAFIELNRQKAAAMMAFIYGDRLLVYNSGYDPASFAELSPGIVLTSNIIQDAIQRKLRIFDFLQGDEVYKYRFGASDTVVYDLQIRLA